MKPLTDLDRYIWVLNFQQKFYELSGVIPTVVAGVDPIIDTRTVEIRGRNEIYYYCYDASEYPEHYWSIYADYIRDQVDNVNFYITSSDFINYQLAMDHEYPEFYILVLDQQDSTKTI